MLLRSLRASMMRSSGASSSWVLKHQPHGVAHGHHSPDARGGGGGERSAGSKLLPLRMTSCAVALGISAVLDAGEGFGIEHGRAAGRALRPSGCKRPRAGHSTARC